MPRGKPKIKTAVMTLRVDPKVKVAAELAAKKDRRSVTNLIEVLILKHCEQIGIEPEQQVTEKAHHEKSY
jgi:predicted HicB family RNase H-like nuclease